MWGNSPKGFPLPIERKVKKCYSLCNIMPLEECMKKIISGKVREVYDLEDGRMVIVTTDRISAFDVILPTLIPSKGKVLNALSNFWFDYTKDIVPNHMISSNISDLPQEFQSAEFEGRTVLVKKLKMIRYP